MTARETAARRLLQLISVDAVGDLLDVIGSDEIRRALRKVQVELRGVADDAALDRALAIASERQ